MVLLERLAGRMIRGCFSARPFFGLPARSSTAGEG